MTAPVVRLTERFGRMRDAQRSDNSVASKSMLAAAALGLFVVKMVTSCV